jgi:hypothetical protein
MRVRLVKKVAQMIDGIDLRAYEPGDILDLEPSEARLLVEEGWAESRDRAVHRSYASAFSDMSEPPARGADRATLTKLQRRTVKRHAINVPALSEDLSPA